MRNPFVISNVLMAGILGVALAGFSARRVTADEASGKTTILELDQALTKAKEGSSEARKRLAVKRVIRDAEALQKSLDDSPDRFPVLEFLFRARQQLIVLDDDSEHRKALLETCRELVKAPDQFAELRMEADLLLSQAEIAKKGATAEERSKALRPFVDRYVDTPAGPKVLRMAMTLALELGDSDLVNDLQDMIAERFAGDLDMISFQRDKLGGQVVGAPFVGTFERSDGKTVCFPMDALGRSTMLVFWSKEDGGKDVLAGLAAAALQNKGQLAGRLDLVSVNLDELADAGESIVRSHGVDWPVLRLPGGREHPVYKAYVRHDPRTLTVTPTGQTAMIMAGTTRPKEQTASGVPDYGRLFQSSLARPWTEPRYVAHISSLMAGEFLVFDPEGEIDPSRPPELKAAGKANAEPLTRAADSVPEDTLRAIQACFVAPPRRYRLSSSEALANYSKAVDLCRKAIAACPKAPDLWIVRNRLMVGLLGRWKASGDLAHLDEAIAEAKVALAAGYPAGCDLVARFCIAREALRDPQAKATEILDKFIQDSGGAQAPGPVFAVAALLALDVAERKHFEDCRRIILERHTESPMMWVFSSFLLDRHHEYWLFQVPFTAGWTYGRREGNHMSSGRAEPAGRVLRAELHTLDGKTVRIPDDLENPWTVIVFAKSGPWSKARDDGLPSNPFGLMKSLTDFVAGRPPGNAKVYLAMLDGDAEKIRVGFEGKEPLCPVLIVPGGMDSPLIHRLGILSEDNQLNSVVLDQDGRIMLVASGLVSGGRGCTEVIAGAEEKAVEALLARGDVQAAKDKILLLAPLFDPEAVDARGRKLVKKQQNLAHLRARARVFLAIGELDKALVDAEEVVSRQLSTDSGMSLRTDELDASEALRDEIRRRRKVGE